jgi:conjugal transfer pilus assembly protein TraA
VKKILLLISMLALPALAFAVSGTPGDPQAAFAEINKNLFDWMTGPLGTGLATTMLVMGGAIGVAKNSPMPALTGVAGAAFLHFAPAIIMNMAVPQGGAQEAPNAAPVVVASAPQTASAPATSAVAALAASQAQNAHVAVAASAPVPVASTASAVSEAPKYLAEKPVASSAVVGQPATPAAVVTQVASQPVTGHASALAHTVPVPVAVEPTHHVSTKAVSSSDLTRWLGLAGSAVILSLLGLLAYLSSRRKSKDTGFTPSATSGAGSAFTDPHGFRRDKNPSTLTP